MTKRLGILLLACYLFQNVAPTQGQTRTTTTLSVTPSGSVAPGSAVKFTAKVQDGTGATVIAGTVSFYDGQVLLGSSLPAKSGTNAGTASYVTSTLPIGSHAVTAHYVGTDAYSNSASTAQTVSISGKYTTTISLKATGATGNYKLASLVTGLGYGSPTGTVTFTDVSTGVVLGAITLPPSTTGPTYGVAGVMTTGTFPGPVVTADFNGDGFGDLALANQDGTLSVYLARGDGTLSAPESYSVNAASGGLVVGDFNGDGVIDIAVSSYFDQSVQVLLGNGDGTFQNAITGVILAGIGYADLAVGDFDQDGNLDLAMVDELNSLLRILKGNGDGTFTLLQTYAASGGLDSVQAGDLNGDGKLDLIFEDIEGGSVRVFLGQGNGKFADAGFALFSNLVVSPVLASVNSDGPLDILAYDDQYSSTLAVLPGSGDGTFGDATFYGLDTPCSTGCGGSVATLDFNRDGVGDVALTDSSAGTVTLLKGKGDGTFSTYSTISVGQTAGSLAAISLAPGPPALAVLNGYGVQSFSLLAASPRASNILSSITSSGSDEVQAIYSGDSTFLSSISPVIILDGKLTATPSLTLNLGGYSSAVTGAAIPVKVIVVGSGASAPTGSVHLYDNGLPVGESVALSGGDAIFSTTNLVNSGSQSVAVGYSGDSSYNPSMSPAVTVQILAKGGDSLSVATSVATTQYSGVTIPISGILSISSLGPNPTGSFALDDGNTEIATAPLSGNTPMKVGFSVNASSTPLSPGVHTLKLQYSGDSNWEAADSTNLVLTIKASDFTIDTGSAPPSLTIVPGSSSSLSLAITALGDFTGTISLSCSGSPSESTCSFSPSSVVNSGTAILSISTTAPHANPELHSGLNGWWSSGSISLALIFFFVRRRNLRRFALIMFCAGCLFGIASCGGSTTSPTSNPDPGTPAGQYTLNVTATSGSISHTIPIQLTVN